MEKAYIIDAIGIEQRYSGLLYHSFSSLQVVNLLENEGIEWSEENRGTVLVKLSGQREFSFQDSASDTE